MQFIVLAYDAKDPDAPNRRLSSREAHLALIEKNKAAGHARYGAAMLDQDKMIGSMLVVEFPSRKELDDWLTIEPYILNKVWENITVMPCKIAPPFVVK